MKEYEPTQEAIESACLEIQATWTEAERRSRMTGSVCLTKHRAVGVECAARFELDGKLAKRRQKLRQRRA
jgi:hypothetical protein